jgi:hypothetical protein
MIDLDNKIVLMIFHSPFFENINFIFICYFQVLVPSAGIRGFLDASEYGTWLKHFQSAQDESKHNVKHLLLAGQVCETCFDESN